MSITVPHDMNQADERILRELREGVRSPSWLADELNYTRQYVHQRLQLLVAAEYVENLGHGLYELVETPEEIEEDHDVIDDVIDHVNDGVRDDFQDDVNDECQELPPVLEDALEEYREKCEHYDSERADARVRAARAIMDLLAESGGVGRKEATEKLLPEYAVDGQSEKTWWQRNGKDILGELDAVVWQSGRNEYVLR